VDAEGRGRRRWEIMIELFNLDQVYYKHVRASNRCV
jgi:hypothetical protein